MNMREDGEGDREGSRECERREPHHSEDSSSSGSEGLPPVELAWEAWLQQLLYELLLMLAMVSAWRLQLTACCFYVIV